MEAASFKITPQAFQIIMQGLSELPHKISRGVIDDLMMQADALNKPKTPEAPPADAPATTTDAAPAADATITAE